MVKADLINRAMAATDLSAQDARDAVEALFEGLRVGLETGNRVVLRRFGVFHAAPRKTGVARNPRTGEPVGIPRGRVVRFRPGTESPQHFVAPAFRRRARFPRERSVLAAGRA